MGNLVVSEVKWLFEKQEQLYKKINIILNEDEHPNFKTILINNYLDKIECMLQSNQEPIDDLWVLTAETILLVFEKRTSILLESLRENWHHLNSDQKYELIVQLVDFNSRLYDGINYLFPTFTKDILEKVRLDIQSFNMQHCKHKMKRDYLIFSIDKINKHCEVCNYQK